MWKLKQIFDGEYGCEERQPGEKEKCLVILANEEGEEKTFEANEDWIAAIEKLSANPLMKIIISKPMAKDCQYKKIVVEKKGDGYQAAKYTEKQVFHDNFGAEKKCRRFQTRGIFFRSPEVPARKGRNLTSLAYQKSTFAPMKAPRFRKL